MVATIDEISDNKIVDSLTYIAWTKRAGIDGEIDYKQLGNITDEGF